MRKAAAVAAPGVFVLVWSTGFIGAKYGLPYAPPLTFLALRLGMAGILLAAIAAATRSASLTSWTQVRSAGVVGLLLHAGYLGGVFYAIAHGLPSSVAAVVVSLQPVLTAVLATRILNEKLIAVQWIGFVIGVGGVALVLAPGLAEATQANALPLAGVLACVVALLSGTCGTIYQKRHGDGIPLLWGTTVQYGAATVILLLGAVLTEEISIQWTAQFVGALLWLVFALSLGAVLLLLVLLRRGSAAGVSSLFYLVPPATAVQAYFLFGEQLPPLSIGGVAVTAIGVALALRRPRPAAEPRSG